MKITLDTVLLVGRLLTSTLLQLGKRKEADTVELLLGAAEAGINVDAELREVAEHIRDGKALDFAELKARIQAAREDLHSPPTGNG